MKSREQHSREQSREEWLSRSPPLDSAGCSQAEDHQSNLQQIPSNSIRGFRKAVAKTTAMRGFFSRKQSQSESTAVSSSRVEQQKEALVEPHGVNAVQFEPRNSEFNHGQTSSGSTFAATTASAPLSSAEAMDLRLEEFDLQRQALARPQLAKMRTRVSLLRKVGTSIACLVRFIRSVQLESI